jgi:hypothetical protein
MLVTIADVTENRCWITQCRSTYVLLDDGGVDLEEVGPDVLRGDGVGVAHHEGGQDGHQSRIVLGQRHNHLNRGGTVGYVKLSWKPWSRQSAI